MRAKSVHKILQKPVLKTGVHSNVVPVARKRRNFVWELQIVIDE